MTIWVLFVLVETRFSRGLFSTWKKYMARWIDMPSLASTSAGIYTWWKPGLEMWAFYNNNYSQPF